MTFWTKTITVLMLTALLSIGGWSICRISDNSGFIKVLEAQTEAQKETNCEIRGSLISIDDKVTDIYKFLIEKKE